MKRFSSVPYRYLLSCFLIFTTTGLEAQPTPEEKIQAAIETIHEFQQMDEFIPGELLTITEGMIIIPKMINAGFVIGGKHGKGIAMIKNEDGSWSDPLFVKLTGGSIGLQIGVQAVDLVLVFKDRETVRNIGNGTFTLGGDVSVAVGPLGRSGSVATDTDFEAEVYSYSKSKGLFAGISINGADLSVDEKANEKFQSAHGPDSSGASLIPALKQAMNELFNGIYTNENGKIGQSDM